MPPTDKRRAALMAFAARNRAKDLGAGAWWEGKKRAGIAEDSPVGGRGSQFYPRGRRAGRSDQRR